MAFADKSKELRAEKKLTQAQLAQALKLSRSCISMIEIGKNEPTATTLIAYSKYFDITTDELLGLDDFGARVPATPSSTVATSGAPLTTEESKVLEQYRNLPEQLRKLIRQQLDVYNSSEELLFKPDKKV